MSGKYKILFLQGLFLLHCFFSNSQDLARQLNSPVLCFSNSERRLELFADSSAGMKYDRPVKWGFIKNVPNDCWQLAKSPFKKKNLFGLSVVGVSTAILIWQDQPIYNGAIQFAKIINLSGETDNNVPVKINDIRIVKIPRNVNTFLYSLGEGGTSMYIAGGLFLYGKIKNDYRSLQACNDLTETFITMGLLTQILKRSAGRQTPFKATVPGGKWQPFPSFKEYEQNTPEYDAFPSGHLATMISTVTVLSYHYPEKKWIKPVGYLVSGLTSFAMMNTGVHWAGDYPLAFALGYLSGRIVAARHKPKTQIRYL